MYKYKLINLENNQSMAELILNDDSIENPWSEKLHLYFHKDFTNYQIVKTDITNEINEENTNRLSLNNSRQALKNVKSILADAKALQNSPEKQVIKSLAKAMLQMAKANGYASPLDSED